MKKFKAKDWLEILTNVAALLVAIILVSVLSWRYFNPVVNESEDLIPKGTLLAEAPGIDVSNSSRTLIVALSTKCEYCTRSLPFYKRLLEARAEKDTAANVFFVFSDNEKEVQKFVGKHELSASTVANIRYQELRIKSTPMVILVDSNREVLRSWVGQLPKEQEEEVIEALEVNETVANDSRLVRVEKTVDLFDEGAAVLSLRPAAPPDAKLVGFVDFFDVDGAGNIYMAAYDSVRRYDPAGNETKAVKPPAEFRGTFCVDRAGSVYFPSKNGLVVYPPSLEGPKEVEVPGLHANNPTLLKMACDSNNQQVYVQTYTEQPLEQALYRFDLKAKELKKIYQLPNPTRFSPRYSPGAFDFAVGEKYLYVSDVHDYKITLYSLADGSFVRVFSKPFDTQEIADEDGNLTNRGMTVGNLTGPGMLKKYPPLFHLSINNAGNLLAWTSQRDRGLRQVVHVYDAEMRYVGLDVKYDHPGLSGYRFANGKVYVPDFGFGRVIETDGVSPLEVPSKPYTLKVFNDSFLRADVASNGKS